MATAYRRTRVTDRDDFLVHLHGKNLLSFDSEGGAIGTTAKVVGKDQLHNYGPEGVFRNRNISFNLELPSAAGAVENDDDWGVGPVGLATSAIWAAGYKGAGVRVGIADSGIDVSLETFASLLKERRLRAFAGFNPDGSKVVQVSAAGAEISDEAATPSASHWHGTFCAATLVGDSDGKARGVAPAAELVVARVLQQGNTGTTASIYAGLDWLSRQRVDVASLSLGWPGKHEEWAPPIRQLLNDGAIIVAAVGNERGVLGEGQSRSPANYPILPQDADQGLLISVGAHDQSYHVGGFSSGEVVDWSSVSVMGPDGVERPSIFSTAPNASVPLMVGPGVGIVEPVSTSTYFSEDGSSMATPHIAGMIALILSALRATRPNARPREAADLVLSCLTPLPDVGAGPAVWAGAGRVDPATLLERLHQAIG